MNPAIAPPLGFIVPSKRTAAQHAAANSAAAQFPKFQMAGYVDPPKGTKVMLTDYWKHTDVIADIGQAFTGFGQNTGSCVGVSEGNCLATVGFVQRVIGENPTKAIIPFWMFPYGRTRYREGDRGQGEGAVDSVMGETLVKEGFFDASLPGLPPFARTGPDGFWYTRSLELAWSDGASPIVTKWIPEAAKNVGLYKSAIQDTEGIRAAIFNGYAVLNGCDNYVGNASIASGGGLPYVRGKYTNHGGHSTSILACWNHPFDGWLYGYSNQWPTGTYPIDPAGLGRCCCWLVESEMEKLFKTGGDQGQTLALSHLPGTPVQPQILNLAP